MMLQVPTEQLVFLTARPTQVPLSWTSVLEQEVLPPLRHDSWDDLAAAEPVDLVFVFPDLATEDRPSAPRMRQAQPMARWVAVLEEPDIAKVRAAIAAGYDEVFDLYATPALVLGPVLRLREHQTASDQERRLLEESLSAYQELSLLDRVRECLRVLDLDELSGRLLKEVADVLGAEDGLLWLPGEENGGTAGLRPVGRMGQGLISGRDALSLHSLPCAADLAKGKIVLIDWQEQSTVFIPVVESDMLLAVIELVHPGGRLLKREEARLRMLRDWLKIALQNSLEAEQMRRVLRSRFGDFFTPESFRRHLEKGLLQATRYRRPLTMVSLVYTGDSSMRKRVFQYVLELLRDADVFEDPDGAHGRILLPETGYMGGVQFVRRIQRELAQKFQPGIGRRLLASIASYPWHGANGDSLFAHLDAAETEIEQVREAVASVHQHRVFDALDVLAQGQGTTSFDDPNLWADLAFHLVQEATVFEPEATRMLLFLGAHADSSKTFAPLFDFPARWDRILAVAAIGDGPDPASGPMNIIRDPQMLNTYLALLERPSGAIGVWVKADPETGQWQGGVCRNIYLVRALFNRFEDQYLLHHKWVS